MLDSVTKKRIDDLRNILVGKIPSPQSQVEQITTGLIYKFMHDMDNEAIEMGGVPSFFVDEYEKYSWKHLFNTKLGGVEKVKLYSEAIENLYNNPNAPDIFREIFKNSFLPFKDPTTLNLFLKEINKFHYSNSEQLGNAYEYLLSFMGSQGDAGQFRTPRHIIDFIIQIVNPQKNETILDPACGTSGFLISTYKHILTQNTQARIGDKLNASERKRIGDNLIGYDIDPSMTRISLVNMYLHNFARPNISEYDTLSSEDRWNEYFDVILANPPFFSPTGGIKPHSRFGVKSTRAEVLFVDYIIEHLKPHGRAGIIVPEGIIFQGVNAYKMLRKKLIEDSLIGVVSLPSGVFQPYSGVKTSILILDKNKNQKSDEIFFAKVNNDGFSLSVQRTPIAENDLPVLLNKIKNEDYEGEGIKKVPKNKILERQDFSLSIGNYLEQEICLSNFPMTKLGEIANFQNGFAFKQSDWSHEGKPIIRIQNLTNSSKSINKTKLEVDPKYFVEKGDLLISWSGTIGVFIWEGESALLNQHIFLVKPKEEILSKYLYFMGLKIKERIEEMVHGNTMTHITKAKFLEIEIPLPPIEEQENIVNELEGYQRVIDGCKQVIDHYKPTFEIDPSWEMVELNNLYEANLDSKRVPITKGERKEGAIPYYGASGIVDYVEGYLFDEDLLLISEDGANLRDRNYPIAFSISGKTWVNNHAHVLRFNNRIIQKYVEFYFNQISLEPYLTGSAQPKLNQATLNSIKVPIPPIKEMELLVEKFRKERIVIEGNLKLSENYSKKIQEKIKKIWGNENNKSLI